MKYGFLLLFFAAVTDLGASTSGITSFRKRCAPLTPPESPRSMEELMPILEANRIEILQGSSVTPANVEVFLAELEKFPLSLRQEMLSRNAGIRLMEGPGVGMDSSLKETVTTEGKRNWIDVPGAGGILSRGRNVPTRLAINHLYDKHGSSNLVLHEHAHTLDSIYGEHSLSRSKPFQDLLKTPKIDQFLNTICSERYCTPDKPIEAFAELFSYFYACEDTRQHMEAEVPLAAEFFRNLQSGSSLLAGEVPGWKAPERFVRGEARVNSDALVAADNECEASPMADISASLDDLKVVANKIQETYPPNVSPTLRSGATSTSAAGMK